MTYMTVMQVVTDNAIMFYFFQDSKGLTKVEVYSAWSSKTFLDVPGLDAGTDYNVTFGIQSRLGPTQDIGISLAVKTRNLIIIHSYCTLSHR